MADNLIVKFANVNEYIRYCTKETDCTNLESETNGASWAGSDSMAETLKRVTKGFPQGTAQAKQLLLKLTPFLRTVKGYKRSWIAGRHAGGSFIMDSYNKGLPDCCMNMAHVISKKFVDIIFNGAVSSGIENSVILARGAAVVALADALQSQNYRVSVKVAYSVSTTVHCHTIINVKQYEQPLELDRLAFFIGDPSALRRLYFAYCERQTPENRRKLAAGSGNGRPIELPANELKENDLYLGSASLQSVQWRNLEATQNWLKETMRRYGIVFNG